MRSAPLSALLALALALPPGAAAQAGDRDGSGSPAGDAGSGSPANRVTAEHQEAIDRGLRWLASRQDARGGFPTRPPDAPAGVSVKSAEYQTAITALCTLAFLGAGHGLGRGPYREVVQKGVDWLLRAQRADGYVSFGDDNQSRMHGHGFATLALAEAYATAGSARDPGTEPRSAEESDLRDLAGRLRKGIQAAVECIESAQSIHGGWGYTPLAGGTTDHEGSVTVCQVQALQAASNRGFKVSLDRIKRARNYMKMSQTASGGFRYRLGDEADRDPRGQSWALAAAGVVSLVGLAEYDRKDALDRAMAFLERKGPQDEDSTAYFFYGSFYAAQAYHWVGGEKWERYWTRTRKEILESRDGEHAFWEGADTQVDLGPAYPTAMCLLMLEVPVGYLSIFAR